jgi:hypothetical protein
MKDKVSSRPDRSSIVTSLAGAASPAFALECWDLSGQQHSPRRGKGATRMMGRLAPLHNECARRLGAKRQDAGQQPDAALHPGSHAFTS